MLLEKRVPFLYLFGQIKYDLLFVLIMAVCTYSLKRVFGDQVPKIPVSLPAFLGTAISLLLSFKLSQSYDRWWEARKIWGSIVNDSRTLVLQILSFTRSSERSHNTSNQATSGEGALQSQLRIISYRQIGWAYSLSRSLRRQDPLAFDRPGNPTGNFISDKDRASVSQQQNKPFALLFLQSQDIASLCQQDYINSYQQVQLDLTITRLVASMGKAERIKSTVFPVTYRQILRGFIYIFLLIMSMALLELNSIWELPLDLIISLPFFMIEKTARYMQDPFENKPTDTAMTTIAATIETNIKQLWNDEQLPVNQDLQDKYYIL